ncbi:MAG: hypothetical protein HKN92_08965 [Chitinophagales bacterium]|nr:hypothetical protein [Chitinophagales bacterium]
MLFAICALNPSVSTLSDLYFLEGLWINTKTSVYEEWHIGDERLQGHSYRMEGKTKIYLETLEIYSNNDGEIILKADVVTNDSPVYFTLTNSDNGHVFENLDHDFPKRIIYRKTKKGLQAIIEGDDFQQSLEFNFIRVKSVKNN